MRGENSRSGALTEASVNQRMVTSSQMRGTAEWRTRPSNTYSNEMLTFVHSICQSQRLISDKRNRVCLSPLGATLVL